MAGETWRQTVLACIVLPILVGSASQDAYRVPTSETDGMETYVFEDKEYMISSGKKTWLDAQYICQNYNGTLAILDTPGKASFMAEALSESGLMLEDVWIGAKREGPDDTAGFRWISGEQSELVRTDDDVWDFSDSSSHHPPPKHYPLWINRTGVATPNDGANCVAFERGFHDIPVFVDLHCKVNRGYSCERDVVRLTRQQDVTVLDSIKCADSEYHVYNARVTFEEAAGFCALHGMAIANIESMKCLEKIARRMLKSRPSIENAWIGAKGSQGTWRWIETGVPVEDKPAGLEESDDLEASWPPFRPFIPRKQEGCLLLDRHVCDHAVFLEARCERKRDFICVKRKDAADGINLLSVPRPGAMPPSDDKYYYSLVYDRMGWNQAEANCEAMNGTLASVLEEDVLTQLLLVMGENVAEPVHHVWVNGRLHRVQNISSNFNHTYQWVENVTNKTIPRGYEDNIQGFFPPWCDDEPNKDYACLNLDRENHLTPLVYGMPCQTIQYSICMIEKGLFPMKNTIKGAKFHTVNGSAEIETPELAGSELSLSPSPPDLQTAVPHRTLVDQNNTELQPSAAHDPSVNREQINPDDTENVPAVTEPATPDPEVPAS